MYFCVKFYFLLLPNLCSIFYNVTYPRDLVPLSPYWGDDSFCPFPKRGPKIKFQNSTDRSSGSFPPSLKYRMDIIMSYWYNPCAMVSFLLALSLQSPTSQDEQVDLRFHVNTGPSSLLWALTTGDICFTNALFVPLRSCGALARTDSFTETSCRKTGIISLWLRFQTSILGFNRLI